MTSELKVETDLVIGGTDVTVGSATGVVADGTGVLIIDGTAVSINWNSMLIYRWMDLIY